MWPASTLLGGGHGPSLGPHTFLIFQSVLTVDGVRLGLGGIFDVWLVQQVLDAEQDLFDGDGWAPVLFFVQQRQANRARWIHVRMEQGWLEFAFWWTGRVVVFEDHTQFV